MTHRSERSELQVRWLDCRGSWLRIELAYAEVSGCSKFFLGCFYQFLFVLISPRFFLFFGSFFFTAVPPRLEERVEINPMEDIKIDVV